jgi:putative nucleotidyltransferase with HDIG domain/PAS domain S-box-containing protein
METISLGNIKQQIEAKTGLLIREQDLGKLETVVAARIKHHRLANPQDYQGLLRDHATSSEPEWQKLANLLTAGEGILGVNFKGLITFANPAAVRLLGCESENILGQPFHRSCPYSQPDGSPIPEQERPFYATLHDGQKRGMEGIYRRQDGASFPVQGTCCAITEGNKIIGAVITFRDITARQEADAALQRAFNCAVKALVHTVEARDPYTSGHQSRVAMLAGAIAREMDLPEERVEVLRIAGALHDLGKIQIPAEILSKPTRLSDNEFNLIKAHPQIGYDIIKTLDFPGQVAEIVLQHHERMEVCGGTNCSWKPGFWRWPMWWRPWSPIVLTAQGSV